MDSGDSCVLEPRSEGRGKKEGWGSRHLQSLQAPATGHTPSTPHSPLPRACPSPNTILRSPGFTALTPASQAQGAPWCGSLKTPGWQHGHPQL